MLATICGSPLLSGCGDDGQMAVVSGASMFPAIKGEHYRIECSDCRFPFVIDANSTPASHMAVCPNCGFDQNSFADLAVRPSDKYWLQPQTTDFSRWDIVGLRIPNQPSDAAWAVKRIVGLPGELIEIRDGNLFANGQLLVKPLAIQKHMLVAVFDSAFSPRHPTVPRFSREDLSTLWQKQDGEWIATDQPGPSPIRWFTYRHLRGYRHHADRYQYTPIEDSYAYNQNVARSLHPVEEIMVMVDVNRGHARSVAIRIDSRHHRIDALFDSDKREMHLDLDSIQHRFPFAENTAALRSVALAYLDSVVSVYVNDEPIHQIPVQPALNTVSDDRRLAVNLGVDGTETLPRVRLFRDIYYFAGQPGGESGWQLDENEYFLLGDNVPVSVDSRRYGVLPRSSILGKLQMRNEPSQLEKKFFWQRQQHSIPENE